MITKCYPTTCQHPISQPNELKTLSLHKFSLRVLRYWNNPPMVSFTEMQFLEICLHYGRSSKFWMRNNLLISRMMATPMPVMTKSIVHNCPKWPMTSFTFRNELYPTERKFLLEFSVCYFANAEFAKFKFHWLIDFYKLHNNSSYKWFSRIKIR